MDHAPSHDCRPIWITSRGAVYTRDDHWLQPATAPAPTGGTR